MNDGVSDGNMRLGVLVQTTLLGKPFLTKSVVFWYPSSNTVIRNGIGCIKTDKSTTRKSIIFVLDPFCPWAVSIASTFHSLQLRAILKTPANGIITDDWLQVRGSGGSLFVPWMQKADKNGEWDPNKFGEGDLWLS